MSGARTGQTRRSLSTDADRWAAVVRRDRSADGLFYYSVRTTGVYCRPGCAPGRPGGRMRFHVTPAEAEQAGFRPCRRCLNEPGLAKQRAAAVARASPPDRDGRDAMPNLERWPPPRA